MYINPINVPPLGVNNYYPHGQVNLELPQFEGGMASPSLYAPQIENEQNVGLLSETITPLSPLFFLVP